MEQDTQNMKVAAVGPRELISGLQAFGVVIMHATNSEEALTAIKSVREGNEKYGIVFVTESLLSSLSEEEYESVLGTNLPVLLTIPDLSSSPDAGLEKLSALTKRAVGIDIFSK